MLSRGDGVYLSKPETLGSDSCQTYFQISKQKQTLRKAAVVFRSILRSRLTNEGSVVTLGGFGARFDEGEQDPRKWFSRVGQGLAKLLLRGTWVPGRVGLTPAYSAVWVMMAHGASA